VLLALAVDRLLGGWLRRSQLRALRLLARLQKIKADKDKHLFPKKLQKKKLLVSVLLCIIVHFQSLSAAVMASQEETSKQQKLASSIQVLLRLG
jgi:hypothetical protein